MDRPAAAVGRLGSCCSWSLQLVTSAGHLSCPSLNAPAGRTAGAGRRVSTPTAGRPAPPPTPYGRPFCIDPVWRVVSSAAVRRSGRHEAAGRRPPQWDRPLGDTARGGAGHGAAYCNSWSCGELWWGWRWSVSFSRDRSFVVGSVSEYCASQYSAIVNSKAVSQWAGVAAVSNTVEVSVRCWSWCHHGTSVCVAERIGNQLKANRPPVQTQSPSDLTRPDPTRPPQPDPTWHHPIRPDNLCKPSLCEPYSEYMSRYG